jgi:sortase A
MSVTVHPLAWRWLERVLLTVGIACLGYFGLVFVDRQFEQARENRELDRILQSRAIATPAASAPSRSATVKPATVLGRLEIPRLKLSATVREGDDARTLQRAVGHIPGTSLPGESGNSGFAAHRDTFFSRLKDIRQDDEITFTAPDGVHRYIVEETRVVDPSDVTVLDQTQSPTITLVTCYPFNYIGSAPQRFIVRAVSRDAVGTSGAVSAALSAPAAAAVSVRVNERDTIVRPVPKGRAKAAVRVTKASGRPEPRAKGNPIARFFKAAARGLGFAPRETRDSAQSESPDSRSPRH